jgi:hypothetical protein
MRNALEMRIILLAYLFNILCVVIRFPVIGLKITQLVQRNARQGIK